MLSKISLMVAVMVVSSVSQAQTLRCAVLKQNYTMDYLLTKTSGVDLILSVETSGSKSQPNWVGNLEINTDSVTRANAVAACNVAVANEKLCNDGKYIPTTTIAGEYDGMTRGRDVTIDAHWEFLTSDGRAARSESECRAQEGLIAAKSVKAAARNEQIKKNRARILKAHMNRVGSDQ